MSAKARLLIYLVALAIFDIIIPIPLVAFILIYVVLRRPPWFQRMYSEIYGTAP